MSNSRYKDNAKNEDNLAKAIKYFEDKGFAPHLIAGIIGNLQQESFSHLDSTIENEIGAVGIAQWLGARRKDLENFAGKQGKDFKNFNVQLDFLHHELNTTGNSWGTKGRNAFFNAKTTTEAAAMFADKFERSGEKPGEKGFDNRIKNAKVIYNKITGEVEKKSEGSNTHLEPSAEERATTKDNIPGVEGRVPEKVTPIDDTNQQLAYQNSLILEKLDMQEQQTAKEDREKIAQGKAQQAQARLNEKMQQKEVLKELIMNSGVEYVETANRRGTEPLPNPQFESFEDGGKKKGKPEEPPQDYDFFNDPEGLNREENRRGNIPSIVDQFSEYTAATPQKELSDEEFMAELDRKLGNIKDGAGRGIFEPEDERGLAQVVQDSTKPTEKTIVEQDLVEPLQERTTQEMEDMLYKYDPSTVKDSRTKLSIENLTESEYNNLPESDKAKMDKELEKRGLLKSLSTPKGRGETEKVQTMLKEQGYDLGNYGANGDGIDGLMGSKTRDAISKYNKDNADKTRSEAFKNYSRDRGEQESILGEDFRMFQNETDIMGFQTALQDKGYFKADMSNFDLNFNESNLGRSHKKREIDYAMYENEVCEYGKECATFVTYETLNTVGVKAFEGSQVRGDAWTMNGNMVKAGGKTLYNVTGGEMPNGKSTRDIKNFLKGKFDSAPELDIEGLMEGDAIHLYYSNSGYMEQALKEMEGDMFTTHVGMIKKDAEGNMFVEHNVNQKMYKNTVEELLKGRKIGSSDVRISGVTRPKYNVDMAEGIEVIETSSENEYNFENLTNQESPLLKETLGLYTETLARNKEALMGDIPVNDREYRSLEKAAVSIAWKESYGNTEIDKVASQVRNRNIEGVFKKAFADPIEAIFGREASKGLTQMKDEKNLNENLRGVLLDNSDEQLKDPKKAALATMYSLSSRYIYLREISIKEGLKLNEDELAKLSTVAWNEDIEVMGRSLQKYKDFEGIMKAYRTDQKTGEAVGHKYDSALAVYDNMFKLKI